MTLMEDVSCQNTVDKMNRVDLADCLRLLKKISDEAELLLEQRRLQEEVVSKNFEHHLESWDPTEKEIESIDEKAWRMHQRSDIKGEESGARFALDQRKSMD